MSQWYDPIKTNNSFQYLFLFTHCFHSRWLFAFHLTFRIQTNYQILIKQNKIITLSFSKSSSCSYTARIRKSLAKRTIRQSLNSHLFVFTLVYLNLHSSTSCIWTMHHPLFWIILLFTVGEILYSKMWILLSKEKIIVVQKTHTHMHTEYKQRSISFFLFYT